MVLFIRLCWGTVIACVDAGLSKYCTKNGFKGTFNTFTMHRAGVELPRTSAAGIREEDVGDTAGQADECCKAELACA